MFESLNKSLQNIALFANCCFILIKESFYINWNANFTADKKNSFENNNCENNNLPSVYRSG